MALGLGPHERLSTLVAKQPDLYDPYRWMCIGNSSTSSPTPFPTQFVVLLHSWVGSINDVQFHHLNDLNGSYQLKGPPSSQLYRTVSKSNDMQFHHLHDLNESYH